MNWLVRQKQTRSSSCDCTENCNCKATPMKFKGADHTNSTCWDGWKKEGTKISDKTGKRVNNCVKE
jgi:hypothetical protein